MKTKVNLTFAIFISAFAFFACGGGSGYKTTDSGLKYKIHKETKDGVKASPGDMMTLDLVYKTEKDSMLFDSRSMSRPFRLPLDKSGYKGDIYEGLAMLAKGDSATFLLAADSFFLKTARARSLPPFIKPGTNLVFNIKVKDIQKKADYEKEQKAMMEKQMQEMQVAKEKEDKELSKYIADNNIKVKPTESGLYYIEVKKGKGALAEKGKKVKVEYRGMLLDGTEFDASKKYGKPLEFELGMNRVIPGWDEGIALMRVGGKAKFIVPSKLGYGSQGNEKIPPFSPLVFEVELIGVE